MLRGILRAIWIIWIGIPLAIGLFPLLIFPGFRRFCFLSGEKIKKEDNIYTPQIPITNITINIQSDVPVQSNYERMEDIGTNREFKEIIEEKEEKYETKDEEIEGEKKDRFEFLEL